MTYLTSPPPPICQYHGNQTMLQCLPSKTQVFELQRLGMYNTCTQSRRACCVAGLFSKHYQP